MRIGDIWNKLAKPKNIPRLFALIMALFLIVGFFIPMALNADQLYTRPAPQAQVDAGLHLAPYDRGGEVLGTPGIIRPQYPENSVELGKITAYMTPISIYMSQISRYFGTSIYSSPGGLIDEVLYYTRGFDTILESSILMMAFVIASWLALNFTMNHKNEEEVIKEDVKKAISTGDQISSKVEQSNLKAHKKQNRRDN
jgi:energy-converting hydrogenase A subunit F